MIVPRRYPDVRDNELLFSESMFSEDSVHLWERVFADYTGRKHAVAVGSGRLGMKMILNSFGLEKGAEVIVPAYTLKELFAVIRSLGLNPVCADIDKNTFNITKETVEAKITERTGAVLATHMFGSPCPIDEIVKMSEAKGIMVLEDCAHSAGSEIHGKVTGSVGHAAFFSFETIKPINTYGGGMIVTDCDDLDAFARVENDKCLGVTDISGRVKSARMERFLFGTSLVVMPLTLLACQATSRFMTSFYRFFHHAPTAPLRYSSLQACVGLEKIKTLDQRTKARRKMATQFISLLPDTVRMQEVLSDAKPNWYFFVGMFGDNLWPIKRYLLRHGYDVGIHSEIADYCPENDADCCPNALDVYNRAVHLPLHEGMSNACIEELAGLLRKKC